MRTCTLTFLLLTCMSGCAPDESDVMREAGAADMAQPAAPASPDLSPAVDNGDSCEPPSISCGACGTRRLRCKDGILLFSPCENEGACYPGDVQPAAENVCLARVCEATCQWGAELRLRPGATCDTGQTRPCRAGAFEGVQSCKGCRWGTCRRLP